MRPRETSAASTKAKAIDDIQKHIDKNWKKYSKQLGWTSRPERRPIEDRLEIRLTPEEDFLAGCEESEDNDPDDSDSDDSDDSRKEEYEEIEKRRAKKNGRGFLSDVRY